MSIINNGVMCNDLVMQWLWLKKIGCTMAGWLRQPVTQMARRLAENKAMRQLL